MQAPAHGAVVSHPQSPLVLKWASVPHAAKYLVTIASDPLLGSAVGGQQSVETSGTAYAPRALLLPPGTYYWGVVPVDAQGHRGVPSPVASFTWTWPTSTSAGVEDFFADQEVYDPFLSWNAVAGAAKYELEVNPTADFSVGSRSVARRRSSRARTHRPRCFETTPTTGASGRSTPSGMPASIAGAKVRGLGSGLKPRWPATNRRGQVVFRFRSKTKGSRVLFQATKRGFLLGAAQVRVR